MMHSQLYLSSRIPFLSVACFPLQSARQARVTAPASSHFERNPGNPFDMRNIRPRDDSLLTDLDVNYAPFQCCGDEDLVFLRCADCGHIWVECYECSTWYVELADLSRTASSFSIDPEHRMACPSCLAVFRHACYLMEGIVDSYLPTRQQVIDAGFEHLLAAPRGQS